MLELLFYGFKTWLSLIILKRRRGAFLPPQVGSAHSRLGLAPSTFSALPLYIFYLPSKCQQQSTAEKTGRGEAHHPCIGKQHIMTGYHPVTVFAQSTMLHQNVYIHCLLKMRQPGSNGPHLEPIICALPLKYKFSSPDSCLLLDLKVAF